MRHRFVEDTPTRRTTTMARDCQRRYPNGQPRCHIQGAHLATCQGGPEAPCMGCVRRPTDDQLPLCRGCSRSLMRWIAETPARLLDVHQGLAPANRPDTGARSTRDGSPDFAAGRALVELIHTTTLHLTTWQHQLADVHDAKAPPPSLLGDLVKAHRAAAWLTAHDTWVLADEFVPWRMDELIRLRGQANRVMETSHRNRVQLLDQAGHPHPCPGRTTAEPCGAELWSTTYDVGDDRPNLIWCTATEPHQWESLQWLRLFERLGYNPRGKAREVG